MSFFKNLLGIAFVQESQTQIQIGGVRAQRIGMDLMSEWGTSKIERNMFTRFSSQTIMFDKFFALDVHYMLRKLMEGNTRTGRATLQAVIQQMEQNTFLKNLTVDPPKFLDRSKIALFHKTPLPHQAEFYDIYEDRTQRYGLNGYMLSAAAGSGKTLTDLTLAEMIGASVVIIVSPKNAVDRVWVKSLLEEYKVPQKFWVAGSGQPYKHERFIVCHYEALEKAQEAVRQANTANAVVILDESHNLNDMESLRTQLFVSMCQSIKCRHVLWASGTPIKALGYETIPLLRTIDPLFTQDVEARFKSIFGRDAKRANDILRNRMGIISFRVEKGAVVDNKPHTYTVKVELPNGNQYTLATIRSEMEAFVAQRMAHYKQNFSAYEKQYNDCLKVFADQLKTAEQKKAYSSYCDYIRQIRRGYDPVAHKEAANYCNQYELKVIIPALPGEMKKTFKSVRSVIKYMQLKVMGEALGSILGKKRAECHIAMIPYMGLPKMIEDAVKKTVIFTSYVSVVDAINAYLKQKDYKPLIVYGETNKDLAEHVATFEKVPEANPLIATYQSLSTAVPLVMANVAVFTNQPFRDHEKIQAQARVDRLGQDQPVTFYDILLDTGNEPNISTRAEEIMKWSRDQVAAILGTGVPDDTIGLESYSEMVDSIEYHYAREQLVHRYCDEAQHDPELALENL